MKIALTLIGLMLCLSLIAAGLWNADGQTDRGIGDDAIGTVTATPAATSTPLAPMVIRGELIDAPSGAAIVARMGSYESAAASISRGRYSLRVAPIGSERAGGEIRFWIAGDRGGWRGDDIEAYERLVYQPGAHAERFALRFPFMNNGTATPFPTPFGLATMEARVATAEARVATAEARVKKVQRDVDDERDAWEDVDRLATRVARLERRLDNATRSATRVPTRAPVATPALDDSVSATAVSVYGDVSASACTQSVSGGGVIYARWEEGCASSETTDEGALYFSKFFTFSLASRSSVRATLISSDAAPYMVIRRGNMRQGDGVASDGDQHSGEARIIIDLQPGRYTIEASTWNGGETGEFALNLVIDE